MNECKQQDKLRFELVLNPNHPNPRYNLVESISNQVMFYSLDSKNAKEYINLYERLYRTVPNCTVITILPD